MKLSVGVFLIVIALAVALFFAISWVVMALVNIVLNHYGIQLLDYGSGMAITALSTILFGGGRLNNGKS